MRFYSAHHLSLTTAADMLSRMDRSVDPCEDFYQYACGGWIKNNIIPEDQTSHGIFHELMESISVQCKGESNGSFQNKVSRISVDLLSRVGW